MPSPPQEFERGSSSLQFRQVEVAKSDRDDKIK